LLKAIELASAGEWDAAHGIVQEHDADRTAAWIHAVLHKMEGDSENSGYWYRRAGKVANATDDPRRELARIREEILELERRGT